MIEFSDKIIGYVGLWLVVDQAQITTIAISKAFRGYGLGQLLLKYAMNYARFSCDVMSLEVRIDNDVAQHVYRNLGFQNGGKKELLWRRRGRISHVGEFEMTNNTLILAIETSCDETSVSVIKNGTELLSNTVLSQIDSHKRFGGVVPEVASRHHVEG